MFWKQLLPQFCAFVGVSIAPLTSADRYQIQFVDDENKPVEFAVIAHPNAPVTEALLPAEPAVIDQIDMQFSPMVIAIEQGRTVSFPNSDNIRHHVYSFSKAKRFETKLYANKPDAPILFDQAGVVVLGCNIHDTMIGYIYVSPWRDFAVSDQNGIAEIQAAEAPQSLEYWHPWSLLPNQIITHNIQDWPETGPLILKLMLNKPEPQPELKTFKRRYLK